jgi:hypothetical protein
MSEVLIKTESSVLRDLRKFHRYVLLLAQSPGGDYPVLILSFLRKIGLRRIRGRNCTVLRT